MVDWYFDDECKAIICEYIEGEDLQNKLKHRGYIPLPEAIDYVAQMIDIFEALHKHHIIHRDIKPANIMVKSNGDIKLCDFGIAVEIEGISFLEQGKADGTIYYTAPEILSGRSPSKQSDIFALGILLFEIICGFRPFDNKPYKQNGDDQKVIREQILNKPLPLFPTNLNLPQAIKKYYY